MVSEAAAAAPARSPLPFAPQGMGLAVLGGEQSALPDSKQWSLYPHLIAAVNYYPLLANCVCMAWHAQGA
jgi:hypothetical protein